jgi:hypothetical protein
MYQQNSRYAGSATLLWRDANGRAIAYTAIRTVPDDNRPGHQVPRHQIMIAQGNRLDLFAATLFGDPTQFWRIAEANRALDPFALTDTPGRRLNLPGRR